MSAVFVPAVVRGRVHEADPVEFPAGFRGPDPVGLLPVLPLRDPVALSDLQSEPFAEIVDLLAELGERLVLSRNGFLQEALSVLPEFSDLTADVLRSTYRQLPGLFAPEAVWALAERAIGAEFLDGWVSSGGAAVRAFGARAVHVIAGNNPIIAGITVVRSAVTRGDAIIKAPANDPVTAPAILRTLVELAPEHPLTRHLSVLYWKGGDTGFERGLYHPAQVEKVVAWGGFGSVQHVTQYLRPGLELIALDPKLSATVIGPEAFASEAALRETARLAAADVGVLNQEGCFNARVIYAATGTDEAGLATALRWGALLHEEVQRLPAALSTPARRFDPELRENLRGLSAAPDWYRVVGGRDGEGAVVVSLSAEPVDFRDALSGRVANVVPIDDPAEAVRAMNSYTQTVGVYPDSLKRALRDTAPLYGVQRLVSLGYATHFRPEVPQDGMEPTRRMIKWITDESYDPASTHPFAHMAPDAPVWAGEVR
ncbi:hypothetical protein L6E12_08215 [Actinokineospora sp. PR83]|uniref:acyl-CoA reductase n=1 Tax=Actinokineospora sp. PR83 TaxID=2884908 RepID=UPI0027E171F6|nr:acyl-CoA reductase [Actinokineospora sp. PR83]MCG8915771.1 hypothetical protein [Actinokineospora sp. PR83]